MEPALTLRVTQAEPELVVEGHGPLDRTAALALDALAAMVVGMEASDLTVDLRSVRSCDVAGLRALQALRARSTRACCRVRIRPSPEVWRVAALAGLSHTVDVRAAGR